MHALSSSSSSSANFISLRREMIIFFFLDKKIILLLLFKLKYKFIKKSIIKKTLSFNNYIIKQKTVYIEQTVYKNNNENEYKHTDTVVTEKTVYSTNTDHCHLFWALVGLVPCLYFSSSLWIP